MPEICRFYGIIIQIYYGDHPPAHFHAVYSEHVAKIEIGTLEVIEGSIPQRALNLAREWAKIHERELIDAFNRAASFRPPGKIAPLE
jgi:hypothetical protein